MATGRYSGISTIDGGRGIATTQTSANIRNAVQTGKIKTTSVLLKQSQRLDIIAGQRYGSPSLWWIIAAASGIGWSLQAPAGTILRIPIDLGQIMRIVR